MSKIDDLCNDMTKEHRRAISLLSGSQNIFINQIGHCPRPSCTPEESCTGCLQCKSLYDKIDKYLKEQ